MLEKQINLTWLRTFEAAARHLNFTETAAELGLTHFHPPFLVHPDFENKSKSGVFADTVMEVDFNVGEIELAFDRYQFSRQGQRVVIYFGLWDSDGNAVADGRFRKCPCGSNDVWYAGRSQRLSGRPAGNPA